MAASSDPIYLILTSITTMFSALITLYVNQALKEIRELKEEMRKKVDDTICSERMSSVATKTCAAHNDVKDCAAHVRNMVLHHRHNNDGAVIVSQ